MTTKTSKKQLTNVDTNPIEQQLNQGVSVIKQAAREEAQAEINTLWKQLLGSTREMTNKDIKQPVSEVPVGGDLQEGIEVDIFKKEQFVNVDAGWDRKDEILHFEEKSTRVEKQEHEARIEEVRVEIAKLANSPEQSQQVRTITVETSPVNAGVYHEGFFESLLKTARTKVDSASEGVHTVTTKAARKGFWNSVKQHGTAFQLSGERVVAQQVG